MAALFLKSEALMRQYEWWACGNLCMPGMYKGIHVSGLHQSLPVASRRVIM